jgi:hypothetical protein
VKTDAGEGLARTPAGILARAPREVRANGLLGIEVALLGEVADAQRCRCAGDGAAVRRLEPGERTEQRRLAAPIRAHYADASARRDGHRDTLEDERVTFRDRDLGGSERPTLH